MLLRQRRSALSDRVRLTARLEVIAVAVAMLLTVTAACAYAHQQEPRITHPESQTVVTEGQIVTVRGEGCHPGDPVRFEVSHRPAGQTQADSDGSFTGKATIPNFEEPPEGTLEPNEHTLVAVCDAQRAGIVVAVQQAELALTGATNTLLPVLGLSLVTFGLVLVAAGMQSRRVIR